MTPELKSPSIPMPFQGFSQQDYAQKLIDEYKEADIPPSEVWAQSFDIKDILYWLKNEPEFGQQAVYLDGRYEDPAFDHRNPPPVANGPERSNVQAMIFKPAFLTLCA